VPAALLQAREALAAERDAPITPVGPGDTPREALPAAGDDQLTLF
jgi:hypothetical protein